MPCISVQACIDMYLRCFWGLFGFDHVNSVLMQCFCCVGWLSVALTHTHSHLTHTPSHLSHIPSHLIHTYPPASHTHIPSHLTHTPSHLTHKQVCYPTLSWEYRLDCSPETYIQLLQVLDVRSTISLLLAAGAVMTITLTLVDTEEQNLYNFVGISYDH